MENNDNQNNSLINAELVKQMGNQAEHAVTHDSEPQLKLDTEEIGVVAPLEPAQPTVVSTTSSLQKTDNVSKIDVATEVAKDFIQNAADTGKRGVDAIDEFATKTTLVTRNAALKVRETAGESVQFVQLKAADIRRFALMAIEWIQMRGRMAKEAIVSNTKLAADAVVLNSKLAGKNLALKGQFLAISATKAADSISEGAFERKETMKKTIRSLSEKVNHEIVAITEPSAPLELSKFDLSLPSVLVLTEEEKQVLEMREQEKIAVEKASTPTPITNELVQNIMQQSQHAMTHEEEPEVDQQEEAGTVSHLTVEPMEAKDLRSSLQSSILMAKQDMKSPKAVASASSPQSIRSN